MFMIPLRPPVWKVPSGSGLSSGSDYLPYILHEFCQQFHFEVGSAVRETIKKLGGTMPEDYDTPSKSLKELEKEKNNKKLIDKV